MKRSGFEDILSLAVHTSYVPEIFGSPERWKARLAESPLRLQWDPDHDPLGGKQERRAIQLGLAGEVLHEYAANWIVSIEDISGFVAEQRRPAEANEFADLVTPREEVYPVAEQELATRLGIDPYYESTGKL